MRNRICPVLDYAHSKDWRSSEAPSGNGSLKAGRGLPRQVKEQVHRKEMPYDEIASFITALQRKHSYGWLALELLILTGVRSQDIWLATCDEFDRDATLWIVPATHMKRAKSFGRDLQNEVIRNKCCRLFTGFDFGVVTFCKQAEQAKAKHADDCLCGS